MRKVKTSIDFDHYHIAKIDDDGEGVTIQTIGEAADGDHEHMIVTEIVMSGGLTQHVHIIEES